MKTVVEYRCDEGYRTFKDDCCGTIRTIESGGCKRVIDFDLAQNQKEEYEYRIRKLTPCECWMLMGFSLEDFIAAKVGNRDLAQELIDAYEPDKHLEMMQKIDEISKISNSQLYKMAGNSIVTNVLYHVYKELYKAMPYLFDDLKLASFFSGIGAFEIGLNMLYRDIRDGNIETLGGQN